MLEKRTFPRLVCPKDKSCAVMGKSESELRGEIKDISRSGLSMVSRNRLDTDSKVDILIDYPELDRQIPSVVRIIWSRAKKDLYTYGTRFVSINNEDKFDLLDHFYEHWKKDILAQRS